MPDSAFLLSSTVIFDDFVDNVELTSSLNNPFLIVVLVNLNVKAENWHNHEKMSYEGAKIGALTSHFGL